MDLESIYLASPIFLQNLVCNLQGWKIQRTRFGAGFHEHLLDFEHRATWNRGQHLAYRDQKIAAFVRHCAENVPYYRRQFSDLDIDPEGVKGLEDLARLPVLTKDQVKACPDDFLAESVRARNRQTAHTSGTTGGGLRFATTMDAVQMQWAVWWRYRRYHRIPLDTWCGYFAGRSIVPVKQERPPFWRTNRPGCQVLFSGYHMSDEHLAHYAAELRRRKLPWLHGYPSLLTLLASYILESGFRLKYRVEAITVGAENLLAQQSELIYQAFGVRPRQHYGMAEAVANISECSNGRLHVDEDFSSVEFVPAEDGNTYRVVGTNFTNPATPLLRYDTDDLVTLSADACACGLAGRVVHSIDGRREDYIIIKNGARLGRLDHIFKDLVRVREAQMFQREFGSVTVRVVKGHSYGDRDEQAVIRETAKRIGSDMEIEVDYMDHLPRSGTGKLRFVVSEIEGGTLAEQ